MENAVEENHTKQRTSAVQRAFALIEMVVAENRPMSLAQMADRLDLPKPTVHRLASRLEADDLLAREPSGRQYTIGPRLNALAIGTLEAAMQRAPRHAVLEALARETGETCNLGVLDGASVVYLDRVETHWPLRLQLSVGSHVPLHCTASGKLFLSQMPKRTRDGLYAAATFDRFTDNTITDPDRLEAELNSIRADGVAINNQEYMIGLVGIAVPVPDPVRPEHVAAALAIHAPEPRLDATEIQRHLPALRAAAARLSETLREPA
jgi:DNA-binding IclR family transcriptional regulator